MRLLDEQYKKVPFYGGKEADGLVEGSWLYSEPEAGHGTDAADGTSGYLSP